MLKLSGSDPNQEFISPVMVDVMQETKDRLHVKIYDPNNSKRWEVPAK